MRGLHSAARLVCWIGIGADRQTNAGTVGGSGMGIASGSVTLAAMATGAGVGTALGEGPCARAMVSWSRVVARVVEWSGMGVP
jgi:hypothetical protein